MKNEPQLLSQTSGVSSTVSEELSPLQTAKVRWGERVFELLVRTSALLVIFIALLLAGDLFRG